MRVPTLRRRWWKRAISTPFFARASLAGIMLRKRANECEGINDYVQFSSDMFGNFRAPFKYLGWTVRLGQVKEEITDLLKTLAKRRPKCVLEIGTASGGTLFLFTRISSPDALIISVDLPGGQFGGGYPEWMVPFYKSFAANNQRIILLRGDSHSVHTLDTVKTALKGRKLDFLFIDGDHTYDGVNKDFEMYSKLVGKGGIIALHDICPHPLQDGCEVNKFWSKIRGRYAHDEIIRDCQQSWAGIGIIYL